MVTPRVNKRDGAAGFGRGRLGSRVCSEEKVVPIKGEGDEKGERLAYPT